MKASDIFETITDYTAPYPYEDEVYGNLFRNLGFEQDRENNWFAKIGSARTIFAAHIDTADAGFPKKINKKYHKRGTLNITKVMTDKTTILGADDRAGVSVILKLFLEKIPGLYYLFIGEECGRIGSEAIKTIDKFKDYDRIICFDRRGYTSIITHQMSGRTCSDSFAKDLQKQFQYVNKTFKHLKLDPTGSYTDSASFSKIIPECTNISIGYDDAHCRTEWQDLNFLDEVADAAVAIDWEGLVTERDPSIVEREKPWWSWNYFADRKFQPKTSKNTHKLSNTVPLRWLENPNTKEWHVIDSKLVESLSRVSNPTGGINGSWLEDHTNNCFIWVPDKILEETKSKKGANTAAQSYKPPVKDLDNLIQKSYEKVKFTIDTIESALTEADVKLLYLSYDLEYATLNEKLVDAFLLSQEAHDVIFKLVNELGEIRKELSKI